MTLPPMIGMDRDLVDKRTGGTLGADQDADRIGAGERDHAAAAPHLQVADRSFERSRCCWRLAWKMRRPAAVQRIDEEPDVVGTTEPICTQPSDALRAVIGLTSLRL
jgi:hypothetical protein